MKAKEDGFLIKALVLGAFALEVGYLAFKRWGHNYNSNKKSSSDAEYQTPTPINVTVPDTTTATYSTPTASSNQQPATNIGSVNLVHQHIGHNISFHLQGSDPASIVLQQTIQQLLIELETQKRQLALLTTQVQTQKTSIVQLTEALTNSQEQNHKLIEELKHLIESKIQNVAQQVDIAGLKAYIERHEQDVKESTSGIFAYTVKTNIDQCDLFTVDGITKEEQGNLIKELKKATLEHAADRAKDISILGDTVAQELLDAASSIGQDDSQVLGQNIDSDAV